MSCEGTTQGDPPAMGMYALAITPLITELSECQLDTKQVWYTDDTTDAETCSHLKRWWDCLTSIGPKYGYFPKCPKCHLVVKPEFEERVKSIFEGSDIHITMGWDSSPWCSHWFKRMQGRVCCQQKVETWVEEVQVLANIASTQPHAVYFMVLQTDGCLTGSF